MRGFGFPYMRAGISRVRMRLEGKIVPVYYRGLIDFYIIEGIFLKKEYDVDVQYEPRIIVDLGANTGLSTLYFKLRYPSAKVYAVEPDPTNAEVFLRNTAWCKDDVLFVAAAVTGTERRMTDFFIAPEHWSSSMADRTRKGRKICIAAITLDALMAQHSLARIDILKFDIEGAEWETFREFPRLSSVRCMTGEVHGDLIGVPKERFFDLFPGFDITHKKAGYVSDRVPVVLHNKSA